MVPIATLETLAFLIYKFVQLSVFAGVGVGEDVVYCILLLERTRGFYFAFVWEILAAYTVVPPYLLRYVQRSPVDA